MHTLLKALLLLCLAATGAASASTQEKIARLSHVMRNEADLKPPQKPTRRGRPGMAQILKSLPGKHK
jgi:hypothetical protein